jgi:hypothetical protein
MKSLLGALVLFAVTLGAHAQSGPYQFYPLSPCRVVDTRSATSTNGGPVLNTTPRSFRIRGNCGVPVTAQAVSLNVTVTAASLPSWVRLWPSAQTEPAVSNINFDPSFPALANGALVGLSANTNDLSVRNSEGTVHLILDVTGYFQ